MISLRNDGEQMVNMQVPGSLRLICQVMFCQFSQQRVGAAVFPEGF
jgi:hypothetical protein